MRKIITLILMSVLFITRCEKTPVTPEIPDNENSTTPKEVYEKNPNCLAPFETEKEIINYLYTNINGKIEINSDEKYITEGFHSLKMIAYGNPYKPTHSINIEFWSGSGNIPKDLTGKTTIKFDIFNASGRDVNGMFFGIFDLDDTWDHELSLHHNLKDGEWYHFEYTFEEDSSFDRNKMRFFKFCFPNLDLEDKDPLILYFDNLIIE
ncbi:MAG: hypothetical protein GX931_00700 [Acholeplasmataceae bacterium]|nr:hypothetical protein [Acholeplasmataceae bacterium]